MTELKLFPGDSTGIASIISYMVYPHDADKRSQYISTHLIGEHGLDTLSKIITLKTTPKNQWTKSMRTFATYPDGKNIDKSFLEYCISDHVLLEDITNLQNEIIQKQINPINAFAAIAKATSIDKLQKEIDKKFFLWIALGSIIRLMIDFNALYENQEVHTKPSMSNIFHLAKKYDPLKSVVLFTERKNMAQYWENNKASIHLYAALAEIAIPDYATLQELHEAKTFIICSITDNRKHNKPISDWRYNTIVKLQNVGMNRFCAGAKAYQDFCTSYHPLKRKLPLIEINNINSISDVHTTFQFNTTPERPPQNLIDLYINS